MYPERWYIILIAGEQKYKVVFSGKVRKALKKLPVKIQNKFYMLVEQLAEIGPVCANWQNYSKLSKGLYHCHLAYHWVACWSCEQGRITIEVYYVGSRENAPYLC